MNAWTRLMNHWDRNWQGDAPDGRCLKDELKAHSAADASSTQTWEGYTVWGIALHVHRYKEQLLAALEARQPHWPEGDEHFPAPPAGGLTEERWAAVLKQMSATHDALLARCRALDEAFLDTEFAEWNWTWGDSLTWAAGHDGYHTAQIRNMKR